MMEEKYEDAAYFFGKSGEPSFQNKAIIYLYYKKIKEDKRNHKMTVYEFRELNQEIHEFFNPFSLILPSYGILSSHSKDISVFWPSLHGLQGVPLT